MFRPNWKLIWEKRGQDASCSHTGGRGDYALTQKINEDISSIMNFENADVVLDIGCSGGALLSHAAAYVRFAVGLDISYNMLSHASKRRENYIMFVQGNMLNLPFCNKVFNKIVCISSLMYIPDQHLNAFFCELDRISKDDGKIMIGQLINRKRARKPFCFRGFKKIRSWNDLVMIVKKKAAFLFGLLTMHDPGEMVALARKYGFETAIRNALPPQGIYSDGYYHFDVVMRRRRK